MSDNDRCTTRVIFRRWIDTGDVIAMLLDCAANPGHVVCYAHIGQHAEGSYPAIMMETRPATATEYAALHKELTQIGYNLIVRKRRSIQGGIHHTDTYHAHARIS